MRKERRGKGEGDEGQDTGSTDMFLLVPRECISCSERFKVDGN